MSCQCATLHEISTRLAWDVTWTFLPPEGPDHCPTHGATVLMQGAPFTGPIEITRRGPTIKAAQNSAAEEALQHPEVIGFLQKHLAAASDNARFRNAVGVLEHMMNRARKAANNLPGYEPDQFLPEFEFQNRGRNHVSLYLCKLKMKVTGADELEVCAIGHSKIQAKQSAANFALSDPRLAFFVEQHKQRMEARRKVASLLPTMQEVEELPELPPRKNNLKRKRTTPGELVDAWTQTDDGLFSDGPDTPPPGDTAFLPTAPATALNAAEPLVVVAGSTAAADNKAVAAAVPSDPRLAAGMHPANRINSLGSPAPSTPAATGTAMTFAASGDAVAVLAATVAGTNGSGDSGAMVVAALELLSWPGDMETDNMAEEQHDEMQTGTTDHSALTTAVPGDADMDVHRVDSHASDATMALGAEAMVDTNTDSDGDEDSDSEDVAMADASTAAEWEETGAAALETPMVQVTVPVVSSLPADMPVEGGAMTMAEVATDMLPTEPQPAVGEVVHLPAPNTAQATAWMLATGTTVTTLAAPAVDTVIVPPHIATTPAAGQAPVIIPAHITTTMLFTEPTPAAAPEPNHATEPTPAATPEPIHTNEPTTAAAPAAGHTTDAMTELVATPGAVDAPAIYPDFVPAMDDWGCDCSGIVGVETPAPTDQLELCAQASVSSSPPTAQTQIASPVTDPQATATAAPAPAAPATATVTPATAAQATSSAAPAKAPQPAPIATPAKPLPIPAANPVAGTAMPATCTTGQGKTSAVLVSASKPPAAPVALTKAPQTPHAMPASSSQPPAAAPAKAQLSPAATPAKAPKATTAVPSVASPQAAPATPAKNLQPATAAQAKAPHTRARGRGRGRHHSGGGRGRGIPHPTAGRGSHQSDGGRDSGPSHPACGGGGRGTGLPHPAAGRGGRPPHPTASGERGLQFPANGLATQPQYPPASQQGQGYGLLMSATAAPPTSQPAPPKPPPPRQPPFYRGVPPRGPQPPMMPPPGMGSVGAAGQAAAGPGMPGGMGSGGPGGVLYDGRGCVSGATIAQHPVYMTSWQ